MNQERENIREKTELNTLQAQLNQQAIDMLPIVKSEIRVADDKSKLQMTWLTLKACSASSIAICAMTEKQRNQFQSELLDTFEYFGYLNSN